MFPLASCCVARAFALAAWAASLTGYLRYAGRPKSLVRSPLRCLVVNLDIAISLHNGELTPSLGYRHPGFIRIN